MSKLSLLSPLLFRADRKLARRSCYSKGLIKKTRDYEKTIVLCSRPALDAEIENSWQPSPYILQHDPIPALQYLMTTFANVIVRQAITQVITPIP